jgi:hypothetical protein
MLKSILDLSKSLDNTQKATKEKGGRGVYLCVGLNYIDIKHYGTEGKLASCHLDATDISQIAKSRGFNPYSKGGVLLNESATRDRIKSAILDIGKYLQPNDFFLLSYSGHGGQIPDTSGEEKDGLDETWCLFDGQLIDDELQLMLSKFNKGVRILILSDSCHSGTVSRVLMSSVAATVAVAGTETLVPILSHMDNEPRFRTLSDTTLMNVYKSNEGFYKEIASAVLSENRFGDKIPVNASVALISGCQDNQVSLDGKNNGLFTSTLKTVWNNGSFTGNYIKFHEKIVSRMPPYQTPNLDYYGPDIDKIIQLEPFTI